MPGFPCREALSGIGYLGTDERPEVASYAEIHIEQGRILEREQLPLGAVDYSWYTQKLDIEVLGEQSHTGATAMADRHDALVAASKVVLLVHDVTKKFADEALVSSVGRMTLEPNSPIVVARRVHLVADLRSASPEIVSEARASLLADIRRHCPGTRHHHQRERLRYPRHRVLPRGRASNWRRRLLLSWGWGSAGSRPWPGTIRWR